jgi:hypothetical protein
MPPSKIKMDLVAQYFASKPEEVLDDAELERLFMDKFHEWNLPPSMTPYSFIQMLLTRSSLEKLHLRSKHYSSLVLYNWKGAATPFTVALFLQSNQAFFSHASAMWIHGLGEKGTIAQTDESQFPFPRIDRLGISKSTKTLENGIPIQGLYNHHFERKKYRSSGRRNYHGTDRSGSRCHLKRKNVDRYSCSPCVLWRSSSSS